MIEATGEFKYTVTGLFDSPHLESLLTLLDREDLGLVASGDNIHATARMISDKRLVIKVREVPQRRGRMKYAVDQKANPDTIVFRAGGIFKEGCLIAGQVGTASTSKASLELFKLFSKEIRRQFTKIRSYHVGKQAAEWLDKGWRLTANSKSPVLYDLAR